MLDIPLNLSQILEYGARTFGDAEIVSFARPNNSPSPTFTAAHLNELQRAADFDPQPSHSQSEAETSAPLKEFRSNFATVRARAAAFAHVITTEFGPQGKLLVSSFLDNRIEHLEVLFGATCLGAVFQPINTQLSTAQLHHVLAQHANSIIVTAPEYAARLGKLLQLDSFGIRRIIFTDSHSEISLEQAIQDIPDNIPCDSYERLLDGRSTIFHWPVVPEQQAAIICYSTGTTGSPKAVVYSQRAIYLQCLQLISGNAFDLKQGERFLCGIPFFHALSWCLPIAAFLSGTHLIFPNAMYATDHLAAVIARTKPHKASGATSSWIHLMRFYLHHSPTTLSLREIFAGGSSVPPMLIDVWKQRFAINLVQVWGMTELLGPASVARSPYAASAEVAAHYQQTQGRFLPLLQHRIVPERDITLESEFNSGEIQVRGHTVTGEYFLATPGTAESALRSPITEDNGSFTIDGWLRSGDIGSISSDGYLAVQDRLADVIRSGGEWIYSNVLELQIVESPRVQECAVIGYPDPSWGERPLALVRLRPEYQPSPELARLLQEELREHFPDWMLPEYWSFVTDIAKTTLGKFDKHTLRQQLEQDVFGIIKIDR